MGMFPVIKVHQIGDVANDTMEYFDFEVSECN